MDILQFISSVIGSLAWPATVATLVVLLREPVKRILLTLTRLKYKDLELDFGRELKQLEEKAKAIEVRPTKQPPAVTPAKKDSLQLLVEAERLSDDFTEPSVALAWSAVEDELLAAVMRLTISPDYPPHNSAMKNAEMLAQQKVIDPQTLDVLKRMRNLRNIAVHAHGGLGEVTTDQAREFIALARGVAEKLRGLHRG